MRRYWISEIGDNRHQLIINGGKMEFIPSQQVIAASEEKLKRKTRESSLRAEKKEKKKKKIKQTIIGILYWIPFFLFILIILTYPLISVKLALGEVNEK